MNLRPYQIEVINKTYDAWNRGKNNVLVQMATGAGKTVTFTHIMSEHDGYSIAIAHRSELVAQMSLTLGRYGIRHRVIASASTCKVISALHMVELGKDYTNPNARHAVASVDTLINLKADDSLFKQTSLVVIDECFPEGTLVDNKPIETIKVGDYVTAYDEVTNTLHKKRVIRTFKNMMPKNMMRVNIGHHVIDCTEGHPFFTKRGWVPAINLTTIDEVLYYEMYDVQQSSRFERSQVKAISSYRARILRNRVFEKISSKSFKRNNVAYKQKIRFGANESQQSNAKRGVSQKSFRNNENVRSQTHRTWRQRETCDQSRNSFKFTIFRYGFRSPTTYKIKTLKKLYFGNVELLQTRPSAFRIEVGNRSGRQYSQYTIGSRTRCEKRAVSTWLGVHSVEILKLGDNQHTRKGVRGRHVYNIEVEGFHTYLVNGVVVHNCHHAIRENKWGRASEMFTSKRVLGVSATPMRSDRKGLGSQADGIFDEMVIGVPMSWLIENGFLTKYRIFAPPCDVDVSNIAVSDTTGDFNLTQLRKEIHKSRTLVGDIVTHYKRLAMGKLGITFTVDIEEAVRVAKEYCDNGVPAEVITGKTPPLVRANIMKQFRARRILQLISVDVLGEGVDIPAVEVVSMARHTASYGLFVQQFGRALRPLEGKSHAIIIDHVNNVIRHGLPDAHREWSLERGERRSRGKRDDGIPVRACLNVQCLAVYERVHKACPFCGHVPVPADRSSPEVVDGDLTELDAEMLARLRGEIKRVDDTIHVPHGVAPYVAQAIRNRHTERQTAQGVLRERIALWAGYQKHLGRNDNETMRRFYFTFGTDIATAQTLGAREAEELTSRISDKLVVDNVVNKEYIEHINNV